MKTFKSFGEKEKIKIYVLKNFDGLNAEVIDVIYRKTTKSGHRDRRGKPQEQKTYVSYKGEKTSVFSLGPSYKITASGYVNAISVEIFD